MSALFDSEQGAGPSNSSAAALDFEKLDVIEEEECLESVIGTLLLGFQEIKAMVDGTEVQLESFVAERFAAEGVSGGWMRMCPAHHYS